MTSGASGSAPRPPHVPYPPVDPGPAGVDLASVRDTPGEDLVAIGADLSPGTVLEAYRHGLFPMGIGDLGDPPVGWWRPEERGVLLPGALRMTRSLRRSCRRLRVSVDLAFDDVVAACADPDRPGAWITDDVRLSYGALHLLGWAHSVEVWEGEPGEGDLVGGLYGLAIGGLFAGESMFHRVSDASKVALVALDGLVLTPSRPAALVDTQWPTEHLESLGVTTLSRTAYATRLAAALREPQPDLARAVLPAPWGP